MSTANVVTPKERLTKVPRRNKVNRCRGLSTLQRQILLLARKRPTRPEILAELCGWTRLPEGNFDRHKIGIDRYNRVNASVSRSVGRLIERGLVEWKWTLNARPNKWSKNAYLLQHTPKGAAAVSHVRS